MELPNGIHAIEDNIHIPGHSLLNYIETKFKFSEIEMICLEKRPKFWSNLFKKNIEITHCTNPMHWQDKLLKLVASSNNKKLMIIDSINQLFTLVGWKYCLLFLKQMMTKFPTKNVILIFHKDCVLNSSSNKKSLQYISQSYTHLTILDDNKICLNFTVLSSNSKIKKAIEQISYDSKTNRWIRADARESTRATQKIMEKHPQELTSFKISVDDVAQNMKDKIVLPYTHAIKSEKESKIIYHHDDGDDWDYEDPDEDLTI